MNYKKTAKIIESFIRDKTSFCNGGVLGLSGGIDSSLVAFLTVNGIGKERLYGAIMPYYQNQNTEDAIEIAETLGINYEIINIKPIVESYKKTGIFKKKLPIENLMARVRMSLLYGLANEKNMLVLGTSNKSELMTGYSTKYGDGGIDIEPIGDLYKTEVWELAKYLGISKKIIDKAPSADLRPGQKDEDDLGDYFTLDKILKGETQGIDPVRIKEVERLFRNSQHKREMPPVCYIEK